MRYKKGTDQFFGSLIGESKYMQKKMNKNLRCFCESQISASFLGLFLDQTCITPMNDMHNTFISKMICYAFAQFAGN